ncbi:hypothetical protein [Streptomyces bluensis]|uniref:Uncharacterized protein n=1 Tax=Streptomyces bluensis TaxID=33897 RepID=A0ABW6UIL1_9ACTN
MTRQQTTRKPPVTLLPIPDLADLSVQQMRGTACVWCSAPLNAETVVDLGARRVQLSDGIISVFPRACTICTQAAPNLHVQMCDLCSGKGGTLVENAEVCGIARTLRRLLLEYGGR